MGKKERKGRVGGKESSKINRNGTKVNACSLLRIYKWEGKHFKRWERYAKYMYVCVIATGV